MKKSSTISFCMGVFSFIAIGCGEEAPENLIDYQKPAQINITGGKLEGVWTGDFETGERLKKATDLGEASFAKVGMRIEKNKMLIQLRCVYPHSTLEGGSSADTWASLPIFIDTKSQTITPKAMVVLEAHAPEAPNKCSFSIIKDLRIEYSIDDTHLTLKTPVGVYLDKRSDR